VLDDDRNQRFARPSLHLVVGRAQQGHQVPKQAEVTTPPGDGNGVEHRPWGAATEDQPHRRLQGSPHAAHVRHAPRPQPVQQPDDRRQGLRAARAQGRQIERLTLLGLGMRKGRGQEGRHRPRGLFLQQVQPVGQRGHRVSIKASEGVNKETGMPTTSGQARGKPDPLRVSATSMETPQ
jgi:hypothetical protein